MVQPYNSTDTATVWKSSRFILSERLDFPVIDNLPIAVHEFPIRKPSFSVDEILLSMYVKYSTNFRGLQFNVKMIPSYIKRINSVSSEFHEETKAF